jgi:hypothetical protein
LGLQSIGKTTRIVYCYLNELNVSPAVQLNAGSPEAQME